MRTTLDINTPILNELKVLQKRERKALGSLVSELLAEALNQRHQKEKAPALFTWKTKAMSARVDLQDKEALWSVLDKN